MMKQTDQKGFTFVEMLIFIVIVGLVVAAALIPLQTILENSPNPNYQTIATALAQERMEIILAQRYINGFSSLTDPCVTSPPAVCVTTPSGYTVTSSIANFTISFTAGGSDSNYQKAVVTVTGPNNTTAVLTALVGNY